MLSRLFQPSVKTLAKNLLSSEKKTRSKALKALSKLDLSNDYKSSETIRDVCGYHHLVSLLESTEGEDLKNAMEVLNRYARTFEYNTKLAESIPLLVSLLQRDDATIKGKAAVMLLRLLGGDERYQIMIVQTGVVSTLVGMVRTEELVIRDKIATQLYFISVHQDIDSKPLAQGQIAVIPHLLDLLLDDDVNIKRLALWPLYCLHSRKGCSAVMAQAHAITKLVDGLLQPDGGWIGEYGPSILLALFRDDNQVNQRLMIQDGAIALLVRFLKDDNVHVRNSAALAVRYFSKDYKENRELMAKAGIVSLLVDLLQDEGGITEYNQRSVQERAVDALVYFAQDADNHAVIARANTISLFVSWLHPCGLLTSSMGNDAVKILTLLSANKDNQKKIPQEKATQYILRALSKRGDRFGVDELLAALLSFRNTNENKTRVDKSMNVDELVSYLSNDHVDSLDRRMLAILLRLWVDDYEEAQQRVASEGFRPVIELLSSDANPDTRHLLEETLTCCGIEMPPQTVMTSDLSTVSTVRVMPPLPPGSKATEASNSLSPFHSLPNSLKQIPATEITEQEEIGRGGFGVVHKGTWKDTTSVAIKKILGPQDSGLVEDFKRETKVHAQLNNPNVITLHGICIDTLQCMMIMEFMDNGSLYDVLRNKSLELPWSTRMSIVSDFISGLLYLHNNGVIHRDIKSLNILIDGKMRAKVSDFGLAKVKLTTASMTKGGGGTPHWMAPELFDDEPNSCASDVYASGIVFWEVAARKLPYENKSPAQIMRFVDKGSRETIPVGTPEKFSALMTRCWQQRADNRPSVSEVMAEIRNINNSGTASNNANSAATVSSGYMAFTR